VLNNCNSKSPGPDDIPYIFLKNFSSNSLYILLTIYNIIWSSGFLSNQWKHSSVNTILKPGKDKFNIPSYLTFSNLSKLLEKMINKRLVLHLETSTILTKQQYSFLKNHFTLDNLATLHSDITDAINNKQHINLLALNIEKAYDMVWKKNVLSTLIKWKITEKILNFMYDFLHDRKIQVKIGNSVSELHNIENGLL